MLHPRAYRAALLEQLTSVTEDTPLSRGTVDGDDRRGDVVWRRRRQVERVPPAPLASTSALRMPRSAPLEEEESDYNEGEKGLEVYRRHVTRTTHHRRQSPLRHEKETLALTKQEDNAVEDSVWRGGGGGGGGQPTSTGRPQTSAVRSAPVTSSSPSDGSLAHRRDTKIQPKAQQHSQAPSLLVAGHGYATEQESNRSLILSFIDNCIHAGVPEETIAEQVRFMVASMKESLSLHAALHAHRHKERIREYELGELTNMLERQQLQFAQMTAPPSSSLSTPALLDEGPPSPLQPLQPAHDSAGTRSRRAEEAGRASSEGEAMLSAHPETPSRPLPPQLPPPLFTPRSSPSRLNERRDRLPPSHELGWYDHHRSSTSSSKYTFSSVVPRQGIQARRDGEETGSGEEHGLFSASAVLARVLRRAPSPPTDKSADGQFPASSSYTSRPSWSRRAPETRQDPPDATSHLHSFTGASLLTRKSDPRLPSHPPPPLPASVTIATESRTPATAAVSPASVTTPTSAPHRPSRRHCLCDVCGRHASEEEEDATVAEAESEVANPSAASTPQPTARRSSSITRVTQQQHRERAGDRDRDRGRDRRTSSRSPKSRRQRYRPRGHYMKPTHASLVRRASSASVSPKRSDAQRRGSAAALMRSVSPSTNISPLSQRRGSAESFRGYEEENENERRDGGSQRKLVFRSTYSSRLRVAAVAATAASHQRNGSTERSTRNGGGGERQGRAVGTRGSVRSGSPHSSRSIDDDEGAPRKEAIQHAAAAKQPPQAAPLRAKQPASALLTITPHVSRATRTAQTEEWPEAVTTRKKKSPAPSHHRLSIDPEPNSSIVVVEVIEDGVDDRKAVKPRNTTADGTVDVSGGVPFFGSDARPPPAPLSAGISSLDSSVASVVALERTSPPHPQREGNGEIARPSQTRVSDPMADPLSIAMEDAAEEEVAQQPGVCVTSPELQLFLEMSQRKVRESERVLAATPAGATTSVATSASVPSPPFMFASSLAPRPSLLQVPPRYVVTPPFDALPQHATPSSFSSARPEQRPQVSLQASAMAFTNSSSAASALAPPPYDRLRLTTRSGGCAGSVPAAQQQRLEDLRRRLRPYVSPEKAGGHQEANKEEISNVDAALPYSSAAQPYGVTASLSGLSHTPHSFFQPHDVHVHALSMERSPLVEISPTSSDDDVDEA